MHIESAHFKNFRNIADASIDIGDAALFFGENGEGKSSVQDGLRMLFLGRCDHTDARGAGSDSLIRHTAKMAEVSADFRFTDDVAAETYTATMTIDRKGKKTFEVIARSTGEMPDDMQDRAGLWRAAGVNQKHAEVSMMPGVMVLSSSLSDALASFLASEMNADGLKRACGAQYPALVEFAKENALGCATAADLEHIGSTAYAQRTAANKEIKDANQEIGIFACEQPKSKDGALLTPDALPRYEAAIQKKQTERDELIALRAVIASQPTAEEYVAALEAAQAAHLEALDADAVAVTALKDARDAIEAAQDVVLALQMKHNATAAKTATLGSQIAAMREGIAALSKDENCKTCGQKISAAARKALAGPAEKALSEAEATYATAKAEGDALLAALQPAHAAVKTAREAFDGAQATATRTAKAVAAAEAAMPAPLVQGETLEEIDGRIAAVNASIASGQEIVKALEKYAKYVAAQARLQQRAARVDTLDWLVKAFKDGEVTKSLLGGGIAVFEERVNATLRVFGFTATVTQAGKALTIWVTVPGATAAVEAARLSRGEQSLVEAAFALAFADAGAPVLLDDLNHLDFKYGGKLLGLLKQKAMGSVIGAVALTSRAQDVAKVAAALVPVKVYRVEGGTFAEVASLQGAATAPAVAA